LKKVPSTAIWARRNLNRWRGRVPGGLGRIADGAAAEIRRGRSRCALVVIGAVELNAAADLAANLLVRRLEARAAIVELDHRLLVLARSVSVNWEPDCCLSD
jgi:hypothetical protein